MNVADAAEPDARHDPPRLIEDACWKRAYRYGTQRLVVYRDPATASIVTKAGPDVPRSAECLHRTEAASRDVVPFAHTILDDGRAAFGATWDDPDIGAAAWADCGDDLTASSDTLLHELNHKLSPKNCLHDPLGGDPFCFDAPTGLPPRSFARLDHVPKTLQAFDDVYFQREGNETVVRLFDELLAYTITTDVQAARAQRTPPPSRVGIGLPLFAAAAVRYVELLHDKHPELFASSFAAGSRNRVALDRLLDRAVTSYTAWQHARDRVTSWRGHASAEEDQMWRRFLADRRRLP